MGRHLATKVVATHGQFQLGPHRPGGFAEVRVADADPLVLDHLDGLAIRTGSYAAPVEVTIDLSAGPPDRPEAHWEDVCELSVFNTDGRLALSELGNAPTLTIEAARGWLRIRIGASGRDAGERRGEVGPRARVLERYLFQIWPAPESPGVVIRSTSLQPVDHTTGRVYLAPARSAAERINASLADAASLSGEVTTVTARRTYATTRRRLFLYAVRLDYWTSATGSGANGADGRADGQGAHYGLSHNSYRDTFDGIPTGPPGFQLEGMVLEIKRPATALSSWEWFRGRRDDGDPVLPRPTFISARLTETRDSEGLPHTELEIEHRDVPAEWADDLLDVWRCKLEWGTRLLVKIR